MQRYIGHSYPDGNIRGNGYINRYANTDCNGHAHSNAYAHCNTVAHSHTYTKYASMRQ